MIDEAKRRAAMEGPRRLLIAAWFRAYTVEPAPSIADILDTAECSASVSGLEAAFAPRT